MLPVPEVGPCGWHSEEPVAQPATWKATAQLAAAKSQQSAPFLQGSSKWLSDLHIFHIQQFKWLSAETHCN